MERQKSTLWTPANVVTVLRVALVPVWLAVAEAARVNMSTLAWDAHAQASARFAWACLALYALISLTDKLDGWLARSRNEVTTFGKFLDPIADKLAVIVALLFLLEVGLVPSWAVFVVVARELLVDGLRMVSASQGIVIPAGSLGKWKTAVTMVAICVLLLVFVLNCLNVPQMSSFPSAHATAALADVSSGAADNAIYQLSGVTLVNGVRMVGTCLLYVAVALTAWSGVDYFVKGWPAIRDGA